MDLQKFVQFVSCNYRKLKREETELVSFVFPAVANRIEDLGLTSLPRESIFDEKIVATEEGLKDVIKRFEDAAAARKLFLQHFNPWKNSRESSIEKLKANADLLHSDRLNSNIVKVVGSSVGIVGSAAAIGSIFFPPLLLPVSVLGGIASGLGSATVCGASVVELVKLKNRMEEAKKVIEEDQEQFVPIRNWFESSSQLIAAIEEAIGFEVAKTLVSGWQHIWKEFKSLKEIIRNGMEPIMTLVDQVVAVLRICVSSPQISAQVQLVHGLLRMAPAIISLLLVLFSPSLSNRRVFDCAIHTQRLSTGVLSGLDAAYVIGRSFRVIGKNSGKAVAKITPRFITKVVAAGAIGIALETVNIVLTSKDLKNGSTSKQEQDIRKVIENLEEEYRYLEQIYDDL